MNFIVRHLLCAVALLILISAAQAQEVNYLGLNGFKVGHDKRSAELFDDYIEKLVPIMSRYGMTLEVYTVVYGRNENTPVDVVTLGTAPNPQQFQAFFQDAEFQRAFPLLVEALGFHQVVMMDQPLSVDPRIGGNTLLTLGWLKEDSADSLRAVDQHSHKLVPKFDAYGVQRMGASLGLQSNLGLTDDLENVAAPQDIQLWSLQDAHGFFDDPKVDKIRKAMDSLFSRKEYLWLEVR